MAGSNDELVMDDRLCTTPHEGEDLELDACSDQHDLPPSREVLASVSRAPLIASDGEQCVFGMLYDPYLRKSQRQLIIFVRHFYCGACQAYMTALDTELSESDFLSIPVPTTIIVIGCGQPDLISRYKTFTRCPSYVQIYTDPSREIFKKLGLVITLKTGQQPDYMKDISKAEWAIGQARTIRSSLKDEMGIKRRDIVRGGNSLQVGGEFLFDGGEVIWCHRMRNMRDHTEVSRVRMVIGLDARDDSKLSCCDSLPSSGSSYGGKLSREGD